MGATMARPNRYQGQQQGGAHTKVWVCGDCGASKELPAWRTAPRCARMVNDEVCSGGMHVVELTVTQQTQRGHLNQARMQGYGATVYMQRAGALDSGSAYTMARLAARCGFAYLELGGTWPIPKELAV